jgi:4-amino-4-deoxy-L-arabinose transferase-like glycosyltransferase
MSNLSRGRAWAAAGVAAGVGLLAALTMRTRTASQSAPSPRPEAPDPQPAEAPTVTAPEPPTRGSSPLRWLAFLAGLVLVAVLLILLQNQGADLAPLFFLALMLGSVALSIATSPTARRGIRRSVSTGARPLRLASTSANAIAQFVVARATPHRRTLSGLCVLSAIALFTAGAYLFTQAYNTPVLSGALCVAAGALTLGAGLRLYPPRLTLPVVGEQVDSRARASVWSLVVTATGAFVLWLVAEANGDVFHITFIQYMTTNMQFALLCLGAALVALGLGNTRPRLGSIDWRAARLVLLITLVGLGIRFWQLNTRAPFLVDEDSFITAIHEVQVNPHTALLQPFSSIAAFPYMFPYFQENAIQAFGRNFVGLRGASAILGALAIPALYFVAKTLFDRKTALLAALLLATFPPHVQFSRIGISEIAGPLFGTLALGFLGRGALHDRRSDYALGGVMLGLTHYFHEGSRVFYTVLAVLWISGLALVWRPRIRFRRLLVALVALVIVAAPIYYTLVGIGRPLFARMVTNTSAQPAEYWGRLLREPDLRDNHIQYHIIPPFLIYLNQTDTTFFYGGETAMILPFLVPLFLLGFTYALWWWRAPGLMLLVMWVLGTSAGNTLLVDSLGYPRYVMVFPALALVMAVGLRYGVPLLWPPRWPKVSARVWVNGRLLRLRIPPRWPERHQAALMAALVVVIAAGQVMYYFNDHLPAYERQFRAAKAEPDGYDAALRSVDFPTGTQIHIISRKEVNQIEANGLLGFFRDEDLTLETMPSWRFTSLYARDLTCGVDHAFFIQPDDEATLKKIQQYFYLRDPQYTSNPVLKAPNYELVLYYAPYIPGAEARYNRKCS